MKRLVLARHGESVWNRENLFTGWTDVELSETGKIEAEKAGDVLKDAGFTFDVCYTSYLKRAIHTADIILDKLNLDWIPVVKSWRLNERHYGALQGLNKQETAEKYGDEQVKIWRRSYDVPPPALREDDSRNPAFDERYKSVPETELPLTESLKDTVARVVPYFQTEIVKALDENKKVIVAAHGNSLRALRMYLDELSGEEVVALEIPTGKPFVYGSICEFEGQVSVFNYRGCPTYRDLYPWHEGIRDFRQPMGVIGALPGAVGSIQAAETLKIILGSGETLAGRLLLIDLWQGTFRTVKIAKAEE